MGSSVSLPTPSSPPPEEVHHWLCKSNFRKRIHDRFTCYSPKLPFDSSPLTQMVRSISHFRKWFIMCKSPNGIIWEILNIVNTWPPGINDIIISYIIIIVSDWFIDQELEWLFGKYIPDLWWSVRFSNETDLKKNYLVHHLPIMFREIPSETLAFSICLTALQNNDLMLFNPGWIEGIVNRTMQNLRVCYNDSKTFCFLDNEFFAARIADYLFRQPIVFPTFDLKLHHCLVLRKYLKHHFRDSFYFKEKIKRICFELIKLYSLSLDIETLCNYGISYQELMILFKFVYESATEESILRQIPVHHVTNVLLESIELNNSLDDKKRHREMYRFNIVLRQLMPKMDMTNELLIRQIILSIQNHLYQCLPERSNRLDPMNFSLLYGLDDYICLLKNMELAAMKRRTQSDSVLAILRMCIKNLVGLINIGSSLKSFQIQKMS